jgi:osmotically-inducible protein OsmY
MALGFLSLSAWAMTAVLSVALRAPAQVQVPNVSPSSVSARSEVAQAVLRKLSSDPHLDASSLTVAERSGIVELGGTVPVSSWRARAAQVARAVQGVRGVVNRIRVVAVRRPDRTVAASVRRSLRATAALAKMPITVRVEDGVVELSGVISTWEQQQLAERVAAGVPGVRFCQNQLSASRRRERTAAMVAADIRSRLDWDPLVRAAPVEIAVSRGHVALKGRVGGPAERRRVIALAWVKGVVAVDAEELVVDALERPDNDVRLRFPTDAEVSLALHDLKPFWPSIAASPVTTTVASGVVTLRGTVQTLAERQAAEAMVRSAVGVVSVEVELRGPWWRPPVVAPARTQVKRAPWTPRKRARPGP